MINFISKKTSYSGYIISINLKNKIYNFLKYIIIKKTFHYIMLIGESNLIRTVPEYGHYRYLRNHKFYKQMFTEYEIFIISLNSIKKYFLFCNYLKYC